DRRYKVEPRGFMVRDGETGKWVDFSVDDAATFDADSDLVGQQLVLLRDNQLDPIEYVRDTLGIDDLEVLVATNSVREVQGRHRQSARSDTDLQSGTPAVSFTMNAEGSVNMAMLTSANVDDQDIKAGLYRYLGIVLDNQLLSAPRLQSTISDRGQITGQFTREEVDFLVNILRAGRLPAVLNPDPIS